jgi:hypothetical protein
MTKFKIVFLLVFFSFSIQITHSQTYKFSASSFSVLEKDNKGKWGQWSDLDLVTLLLKLDTDKNRIVIYSQAIQLFDIVEYHPIEENENDRIHSFTCKDTNGEDCTISIITRKKQGNRKQLYINYKDRIILYNIFNYK